MTLGLPDHVARSTSARALAAAAHGAGLCALCFALANILIAAVASSDVSYLLSILAVVPMGALIVVLSRRRTLVVTIVYLVAGSLGTYFYTLSLLDQTPGYRATSLFVFALPVVAMSLVGGAGSGALVGVLWCSLGFALAELMVWAAAATAGRDYAPNVVSLCAYLFAVTALLVEGLSRRGRRAPQSSIYRAAREGQLFRLRQELAIDAAAELHDSTISELIAVANSSPGPLRRALRARIEADLEALGRDRVAELRGRSAHPPDVPWIGSELHAAIEVVREEGLTVEVSGDLDALGRVNEERRRAIALAVRQCLVNVLRHSGRMSAEVAISASSTELTVLVVDSGRGFADHDPDRSTGHAADRSAARDPDRSAGHAAGHAADRSAARDPDRSADHAADGSTGRAAVLDPDNGAGDDRLGLRHSVRDRIERVGGEVTIWSSPDVGTTVMLAVPSSFRTAADEELAS